MSEQVVSAKVWTIPNVISFARIVLVPVFAFVIATERWGWAIGVLVISGISDWADGFIARRMKQVTRLGQVLDPAADRLFILVTLIAFGWVHVVPWWIVGAVIGRDVVLGIMLLFLAARGYGPLPVSYTGKAGTFALMCAFPLLLCAQVAGPLADGIQIAGWACAGWGVALYWVAGVLYLRQAATLLRESA